ncbi:bifunctional phosphopantothenoylcysteine decarboxylase/phosphopantothenate--cysteine ligase CoaBC [Planktomarina sp.]|nr:bifunctional phosphopantothenoylcysteine decarboxylase/phosphopantothenate--cysteine ligase CoaBC [Planktomarina sp.]
MLMDVKKILLIITGGIAAVKAPELIRRLTKHGFKVTPVLTKAAEKFVTPLSIAALARSKVYSDLFDLKNEVEMGHIELSRSADLILVAPATANIIAKMVSGISDDLASTILLATDAPVMVAPSMNVRMWDHPATQRNLALLDNDTVKLIGPNKGEMACGEYGLGRMAEVSEIVGSVEQFFYSGSLVGKHLLVTSGATREPIDPIRYITNRSSGTQGSAIAAALRDLGAQVSFVTGPTDVPVPLGVTAYHVETAQEMLDAVQELLPVDGAVFAAAVADWRVDGIQDKKIKKSTSGDVPELKFLENPDILAIVSQHAKRPKLVVGFAAETDDVIKNARNKLSRKGCDWIVANDVSSSTGIVGGQNNTVTILDKDGVEAWEEMSKTEVAFRLAQRIVGNLA